MTGWLSVFMNGDGVSCRHDWLAECKTDADIAGARVDGMVSGISDTCGFLCPEIAKRVVIVTRPVEQVNASLSKRFGVAVDMSVFSDLIAKTEGLHICFSDLKNRDVIAKIWDYCSGGLPFPDNRWHVLKDMRIDTTRDYLAQDCGPLVRRRLF
mgnify:CR=1 FL=1